MIRIKQLFLALLALASFSLQSFASKEKPLNFNAGWQFMIDKSPSKAAVFSTEEFDDSAWETVNLPHTAHLEPLVVNNQWQGICWYRKTFKVPDHGSDQKVFIRFEAAMNYAMIWMNGKLVKSHQGGYLPVVLDVTPYLKPNGDNLIAVRLDNTDNPVTGPKPLKILDFNMYGGLYRPAHLIIKKKIYITDANLVDRVAGGGVFVSFPKVAQSQSQVQIKTNVANEFEKSSSIQVVNKIFYKNKLVAQQKTPVKVLMAGQDAEFVNTLAVSDARLWSPDTPELYHAETLVLLDGKLMDKETTRFGIRQLEFKNNKLFINGKQTFLRGVNRHQEYPFIGYALSDNAQYRDAKKIKEAGFNYIRLSHYPQSPAFMDACDELGLLVADAILGWQYYADNDTFRNYCYTSARQLVRRDRNHPSVLAWEVSLNETKMPVFFMQKLHDIVHEEYPGENVYTCGWMDDVYDIYFQARQHRILHPHPLKDKPYAVSEYGDWEYYSNNAGLNQDKLPKNLRLEKSSRQFRKDGESRLLQQLHNVMEAHNDNMNTRAFADSYWVMYDYNRGYYDDIEASGLMDIFRLPKFAYYFYQSQQDASKKPVLKIASYWNEKSPLAVKVLSNCETVKLYLNDKLVASQKPDKNQNTTSLSHPPFTFNLPGFIPGELRAEGYINGKKIITESIKTPEQAVALKMWPDLSGKAPQTGQEDALFVYVAAVDKNGTIVPDFEGELEVRVREGLTLLNIDKPRFEAGISTLLIKVNQKAGRIEASFQNLKAASLTVRAQR